jgi:energy-coupling factor transport system permease protein
VRPRPLDPRAWLVWAVAASVPPLIGRNPWPLAATLLAVLGVWGVWSGGAAGARWRPLLRLALIFAALSVLFNLLTAHVGDRVIGALPAHWPIVGGPLTLNALVYGLFGAMAILTLVTVSATLGATLDWSAAMRLLPERMAPLAVAGSVAWSYLPRTTAALAEIREAQAARGYRPRGARDALPLLMPLLAGGLERAMITAEALEARAFGAPLSPGATPRPWQAAAQITGLVAAVTGAFCLALGLLPAAAALLILAALSAIAGLRQPQSAHAPRRTRYRDPVWERAEWIVSSSAVAVLVVEIAVLVANPAGFRYEPYPTLTAPAISLPLLAALGLLLAPAAVQPALTPRLPSPVALGEGEVVAQD